MFQVGLFCQEPVEYSNLLSLILVTFDQPECNIRHEIIARIDLHVQTPTCVAARNDRHIRLDWPPVADSTFKQFVKDKNLHLDFSRQDTNHAIDAMQ
jgi:hypothetical protein